MNLEFFFLYYLDKKMGRSNDGKRNILLGWPNTFLSMSLNGIFLSGSSATGLFLLPCFLKKYVITPNATVTMTTPKPTNTGF